MIAHPCSSRQKLGEKGRLTPHLPRRDGLGHDGAMSPKVDLIRYYRWLRRYGLNDSHSGNASVRDGETVWVTPTGACADLLEEGDLVACSLGQAPSEGASLDAALHLTAYAENHELGAVLHSHGPYSVALTLDGMDFSPLDFEGRYYFPRVPVIDIPFEDYLTDSPRRVAAALAQHKVCVVRGHGVYAGGSCLNLAYKWTCSLELSAKTAYIARTAGVCDT
jgi:L-fuculose-phosphate aldolase